MSTKRRAAILLIALITLFSCGPLAALQHRWHRGGRPPPPQPQRSKAQKATSRRPASTRRPQPQSFKPQHPDSHANPAVHGFGNHGVLGSLHASGVDFIWPKDDEAAFASQWLHRALRRTGTTTTTTGVVDLALDLGTGTGRFARSLVEHGTARQVVALDAARPMLQRAMMTNVSPRIDYRCANVLTDPLPHCDLAVAGFLLHEMPSSNYDTLFSVVAAALAPGAIFAVVDAWPYKPQPHEW